MTKTVTRYDPNDWGITDTYPGGLYVMALEYDLLKAENDKLRALIVEAFETMASAAARHEKKADRAKGHQPHVFHQGKADATNFWLDRAAPYYNAKDGLGNEQDAHEPAGNPLPPEILADALQDKIHEDTGAVRAARSVKSRAGDPVEESGPDDPPTRY